MLDLARRLLALEAANPPEDHSYGGEATRVYEKLRISLSKFAGAEGFTALMRRALALAKADVPALRCAEVGPDGSILGIEAMIIQTADRGVEATTVLTAYLLTLLVTFIGERLTLRLVQDAWPESSIDAIAKQSGTS